MTYTMRAKVWLYPGPPAGGGRWHFLTLPKRQSDTIRKTFGARVRELGLPAGRQGSLPVLVTIGPTSPRLRRASATTWKTSIFPDRKSGAYLLPLKAEVRKRERIKNGDTIVFSLRVRV
ncbi:DUF1905 domain-containing protein [Candidatus Parcubacteria bacterium]|nr:MAG: DUF1905 domain-containing protein [Candidatus Parcubacteria bacterium]